jgi:hypothetical protein
VCYNKYIKEREVITMKSTNYIIRTVNGKQYGFKATRVVVEDNTFAQKVYDFGTERFPSGSRIMVKVWDKTLNRMVAKKIAHCLITEAIITNIETKETFVWTGAEKIFD